MKTNELFRDRTVMSFEVFTPKPASNESVIYDALEKLSKLNPDCISVTYGAGGGSTTDSGTNCKKTTK